MATVRLVVVASTICPAASNSPLTTNSARDPKRSTKMPAGIWATVNTATWMNTNKASWPALIPNRWAASSPATDSVVRCMTVTA